jgi:hypothetical protein
MDLIKEKKFEDAERIVSSLLVTYGELGKY